MGRKRKSGSLVVALNGWTVGSLSRAANGATRFEYTKEWLDWENRFPISRSMPLRTEPYTGEKALVYFRNLLPDDKDIIDKIASEVNAQGTDPYSMLEVLGRDCVGALQFLPEGEEPKPPSQPEGKPMTDQDVADLIKALPFAPLGAKSGTGGFRISLAGAQAKTALLFLDGQLMEPIGATPTSHILKPQIGELPTSAGSVDMSDSVQNEHFCMTLCGKLGLQVASSTIQRLPDDLLVLAVKRFDRRYDREKRLLRIPQEDFCQALGVSPSRKYEFQGGPDLMKCLNLIKSSDKPERDRREFMKSQIVFWLIAATDGHAKNFSLFLNPRGGFEMTPLYDIISTQWNHDRGQIEIADMKLAMSVGETDNFVVDHITPYHFEKAAIGAGIDANSLREIMSEITSALPEAIKTARSKMDDIVPEAMMESISNATERRAEQIDKYLA